MYIIQAVIRQAAVLYLYYNIYSIIEKWATVRIRTVLICRVACDTPDASTGPTLYRRCDLLSFILCLSRKGTAYVQYQIVIWDFYALMTRPNPRTCWWKTWLKPG